MTVVCDICGKKAVSNTDNFYLVRITDDGLDFSDGMIDYLLCGACLATKVSNGVLNNGVGLGKIQSVIRIENPMM